MDISFTIGDITYEVPEVINLQLFERALSWDITDYKNLKPFVATVTGCSVSELDKLDTATFELILGVCISLIDVSEIETKRTIGLYKLKPFEEYSFGDFVDIDILLAGSGIQGSTVELAQKMYGLPLSVACETNIKDVWGALIELVKWRQLVYREYKEFFEIELEPSEEVPQMSIEKLQFMWYEALYVLADELFLNISKVVKRPYKEALNFLTYKKHLVNKAKLEQLKRNNDIQRRIK